VLPSIEPSPSLASQSLNFYETDDYKVRPESLPIHSLSSRAAAAPRGEAHSFRSSHPHLTVDTHQVLPSTVTSPSVSERHELMARTAPMESYGMNLVVGPATKASKGKVRVRGYAIGTQGQSASSSSSSLIIDLLI
jgi:hypothetical protein